MITTSLHFKEWAQLPVKEQVELVLSKKEKEAFVEAFSPVHKMPDAFFYRFVPVQFCDKVETFVVTLTKEGIRFDFKAYVGVTLSWKIKHALRLWFPFKYKFQEK